MYSPDRYQHCHFLKRDRKLNLIGCQTWLNPPALVRAYSINWLGTNDKGTLILLRFYQNVRQWMPMACHLSEPAYARNARWSPSATPLPRCQSADVSFLL